MTYKYLRDPLFVFCFALYFANRWFFKPWLPNTFSQCYLNDLICIPFWVPIMLCFMRRFHLRADDAPPQSYEILIPLLLWSFIFELWLPHTPFFRGRAISDHTDILFYTLGGLLASLFWRRWYHARTFVIGAGVADSGIVASDRTAESCRSGTGRTVPPAGRGSPGPPA